MGPVQVIEAHAAGPESLSAESEKPTETQLEERLAVHHGRACGDLLVTSSFA